MSVNTFLISQTGTMFGSVVTLEDDGSLTVLSNDGKGYRSAHRAEAKRQLGKSAKCIARMTWLNLSNVRVVCTQWVASQQCAEDMADYFATKNPNFDRERFLKACGVA